MKKTTQKPLRKGILNPTHDTQLPIVSRVTGVVAAKRNTPKRKRTKRYEYLQKHEKAKAILTHNFSDETQ